MPDHLSSRLTTSHLISALSGPARDLPTWTCKVMANPCLDCLGAHRVYLGVATFSGHFGGWAVFRSLHGSSSFAFWHDDSRRRMDPKHPESTSVSRKPYQSIHTWIIGSHTTCFQTNLIPVQEPDGSFQTTGGPDIDPKY